jgi:membrane protease YdiL (CAAX protease family)
MRVGEPELALEQPAPLPRVLALPGGRAEAWRAPDLAALGEAVVPLAIVFWAILVPPLRPLALALVVAGFLFQRRRGSSAAWPWAATVPLATIITWSLIPAPAALPALASCASLLSPPMVWRVTELGVVLVVVALVARWLGAGRGHLPLARADGWFLGLATTAGFAIAPAVLLLGEDAARPFFGEVHLQIGLAGAIAPALLFAFANATLEETVYRGVLLGWTERHIGTAGAIVVQAAAFGLAHTGSDFISSPVPVLGSMFVMGVLAGLVVKRTGSLLVPIIIHAAFDVALYYNLACRLP